MKDIINRLIFLNKTISTMESCTGGYLANSITNISGASKVFKFGAVTYSNEYKIKMGVDENVISKYSVYNIETAKEMSKKISLYTCSDYGVGITGTINEVDPNNKSDSISKVYISIYIKEKNEFMLNVLDTINKSREENKKYIVENIVKMLRGVL